MKQFNIMMNLIKSNLIYIASFLVMGILFFVVSGLIEDKYKVTATILNSIGATLTTIGVLSSWIEILNAGKLIDMIKLFGDHKDEGIERIFPSRNSEYLELKNRLLTTCKIYKASTLIGRHFISTDDEIQSTINLADKCSEFEILFMDPTSPGYTYRYEHQEETNAIIYGNKDDLKTHIKESQEKIKNHLKNDSKKSILHYKTLSPFSFEIIDDYLFVSFYGVKTMGLKSPVIVLKRNKKSDTFRYFYNQYEQLRNEAA